MNTLAKHKKPVIGQGYNLLGHLPMFTGTSGVFKKYLRSSRMTGYIYRPVLSTSYCLFSNCVFQTAIMVAAEVGNKLASPFFYHLHVSWKCKRFTTTCFALVILLYCRSSKYFSKISAYLSPTVIWFNNHLGL